jgi:2-polyprenyl-6-methoxyphenol hydroxylase-like FAD-dependent oxidoreductase
MFRHPEPEVLVVRAGPVGLVAALFLHQDGVRVAIVDTPLTLQRGTTYYCRIVGRQWPTPCGRPRQAGI